MNNEEKILELLAQIQKEQKEMRGEQQQIREDITGLKAGQRAMQEDISAVKLRLELDVEKRFDAVNEGVDAILEQLTPKRRVEEMDADITVLKTAVKMLTQEVAELKKAQ